LLDNFKNGSLKRDVVGELIRRVLNPGNWGALFRAATRDGQVITVLAAGVLAAVILPASAQDIEPRAYSNAPVGVNFLIAGYGYTRGGLAFDTSAPVTNPQLHTSNAVLAYARALDLWGKSGKVDVIVPYSWLSGTADFQGATISRTVSGFANPLFRLSVNLYGAPALTLKEFADYQQDLIVGVSLQVSAPWSQYDDSRVVNIGTNRWFFKPELGVPRLSVHGQRSSARLQPCIQTTTISTAATSVRRIRSTHFRDTRFTPSLEEFGAPWTPRTLPVAGQL
jgi:hypothetical protein